MSNQQQSQPAASAVPAKKDGPAATATARPTTRIVRHADGRTPEEQRSDAAFENLKHNFEGEYRVRAHKIALPCENADEKKANPMTHHPYAQAGDEVYLSHEDAVILYRAGAIETKDEYERRAASEAKQKEITDFLKTQSEMPLAAPAA